MHSKFSFFITPRRDATGRDATGAPLERRESNWMRAHGSFALSPPSRAAARRRDAKAPLAPRKMLTRHATIVAVAPTERRELDALGSEQAFDDAINSGEVVVVDFMATWCRKCIFLKGKLEKFAARTPAARFCWIDVNAVPQALIRKVGVESMPTLQIYVRGEKVYELVAGEDGEAVIRKLVFAIEEAETLAKKK